jgi:hypothetical protein
MAGTRSGNAVKDSGTKKTTKTTKSTTNSAKKDNPKKIWVLEGEAKVSSSFFGFS